ncbi:hypothetical protein NUU61_000165 [Penicillium alfredii]|uniref:N-acetyltransferase domain-containing protein n=1 Tax=Penicillium alfredii TaxID=1506179 RepID=A0A9W9KQR4_9EURO|nr:uncharacterized protein NUU61_000165 [Penicillium alfredii]KAJ5114406.1 hypothetical protein NUU61_000165 [Penicillium alfredii]
MALEIEPANPSDASQFTEVFLAAFSDDFNRTMFPATPDVREWLTKDFSESIARSLAESSHEVYLKVTDPSHGKLVAFAKWKRPVPAANLDRHDDSHTAGGEAAWPKSSDTALCGRFFSEMDAQHQSWMGGRLHFYLDILAVHPSHQGRGLASKLLKWGLVQADDQGVETYLTGSPSGKPMYIKYAFEVVGSFMPVPGHEHVCMIRSARGKEGLEQR